MTIQAAKKIIKKFKNIKTLPHVVTKLSSLINDENATMRDFEDVIKMDPTLVVRLLRLVNSSFYGLSQKVDSIDRAVAFIGMKNLHNMAVTDAMKNLFTQEDDSQIFSRKQLWLHSAAVSICAKMLAERIFALNGDDAYLCGILHDFGIIVEEQVEKELFMKACQAMQPDQAITKFEQPFLGTDHCEIGYLLTQDWGMAENIQEAIRDHHTINEDIQPESLTGIIQISEYITAQLQYTALPDIIPKLSPPLTAHLQENMDEYSVLIDDFPSEMEKAKSVYSK